MTQSHFHGLFPKRTHAAIQSASLIISSASSELLRALKDHGHLPLSWMRTLHGDLSEMTDCDIAESIAVLTACINCGTVDIINNPHDIAHRLVEFVIESYKRYVSDRGER